MTASIVGDSLVLVRLSWKECDTASHLSLANLERELINENQVRNDNQ
jgi:hypothetical protein